MQLLDKDKNNSLIENYQHLLVAMLVLHPPLRTSYYAQAKFITTEKDNDKINNFLFTTKRGKNKAFIIVNKDKVSNTAYYKQHKEHSKQQLSDELSAIIFNSIEKYPRTFLFENPQTNTAYKEDASILRILRTALAVNGITIDMMRSSYINHFYATNQQFGEREKLAHVMRHSTTTAARNYFKVSPDTDKNKTIEELKGKVSELELKTVPALQAEIIKYKSSNDEYKKVISEQDDKITKMEETINGLLNRIKTVKGQVGEKHDAKMRKDILYKLNTKHAEPRTHTLLKYGIVRNSDGIYI
jgi:uncharacterized coiled-coil protein SlyX